MRCAISRLDVAKLGAIVGCMLFAPQLALAQNEGALREAFEGRTVAPRIEMPGSADGITVTPEERPTLDFGKVQASVKQYGVAIARGRHAMVTRIRIKKAHIEFHLDGGGFGTLEQALSGEFDGSAQEKRKRAEGGSRFNIRFKGTVPARYLHADTLRLALAKYLDFDPPEMVAEESGGNTATSAQSAASALSPTVPIISTAPGQSQRLAWRAQVGWDREIFPSFIIATANVHTPISDDPHLIGDPTGLIGIRVTSPAPGARVKVTVSSPGLMQVSELDTILPSGGTSYLIAPRIAWDFDALARVRQVRPATVVLTVSFNGEEVGKVTERVTLRSINDCPFFVTVEDGSGKTRQHATAWMFAAYVNENHPWNEELRREALQAGIVSDFGGYQAGDPQEVIRQVYAIWNVLQRRGVKYSNITTTARESSRIGSQQVRFIDQTIKNTQANCVDGSVLFASLMREVGIDPVLVLVPGHMFVGFYLDPQHTQVLYLETTMLGRADLRPELDPWGLGRVFGGDKSWATFTQAWQHAGEAYTRAAPQLSQGLPQYQVVDIRAARQLGLLPIAFAE